MKGGVVKDGPHGGPYNLGVPEIHCSRECNRSVQIECRSSPQNSPDVSRILYCVQNQEACVRIKFQTVQAPIRNRRHCEDPLGRLGLGCASELGVTDAYEVSAGSPDRVEERSPAGGVLKLRAGEDSTDLQPRAHQFLDRADAFRDEQRLTFPRLTALQIPRKREKLQCHLTDEVMEWVLPL